MSEPVTSVPAPNDAQLALRDALGSLQLALRPRWVTAMRPLTWEPTCTGPGWEVTTPKDRMYVSGGVYEDQLRLDVMEAERKGTGLGTEIMECLKAYADGKGLGICLFQIENWGFFGRFGWLRPERGPDDVVLCAWYESQRRQEPQTANMR